MRVKGHHQVVSDEREDQRKGQHIEDGQQVHPFSNNLRFQLPPPLKDTEQGSDDAFTIGRVHFLELQRIIKVTKAQAVKTKERNEIPGE